MSPSALNPAHIYAQIDAKWQTLLDITCFDSVASTNSHALSHAVSANRWQLYVAEQQTAGRGRMGRSWYSPQGENIYLSLTWAVKLTAEQWPSLAALSLVAGLSVVRVLQQWVPNVCWQVKWPNDIWGNGHKVAGLLLESQGVGGATQLVLGLGLNVNGASFEPVRRIPAPSSLRLLTGQEYDRHALIAALINQLVPDSQQFLQQGLPPFQDRWAAVDALYGQTLVAWIEQGVAVGIDSIGRLLLRTQAGDIQACAAGEVQLKRQEMDQS